MANDQINPKKAIADIKSLRQVFTIPEREDSTLIRLEKEISKNLMGFLNAHVVAGDILPADLERDFLDTKIPDNPTFVSDHADFLLRKVVAQSVHTAAPSYVGHMTSAMPYFMLPLAKIMVALNQNTVKIETAKSLTPLESQVIAMIHRLVYQRDDAYYQRWTHDREHAVGVFCSGGTIANLTALWTARNRMLAPRDRFSGIAGDGLAAALAEYGYRGLAILASRRSHYSLRKAADVLGLGRNNLIGIQTDQENKINIRDLHRELVRLRDENIGVLAIVGIAGTTETGSVDPLDEMADLAREFRCHFHVDAAWGGPTLFSDRYRSLLKGIERADSVIIDAHKQLYIPVGAGICIFKDETALSAVEQSAAYVIRKGSRDLGKHTLEGSRSGIAMLVHSGLRIVGRKGYELLIDMGIGKAGQFAKMIEASADFELMTRPELNILTYRFRPEFLKELLAAPPETDTKLRAEINDLLTSLTADIQKEQRARGQSFVSRTSFDMPQYGYQNCTVFRVVLANPLTTRQILADILDEQRAIAMTLMETEGYGLRLNELKTGRPHGTRH